MALYRALRMGTLPDGKRVRENETFTYDGPKGAWMEAVEDPLPAAIEPEPEPEPVAEAAPETPVAESKRKGKRKETE